jgi:hypothetical protein
MIFMFLAKIREDDAIEVLTPSPPDDIVKEIAVRCLRPRAADRASVAGLLNLTTVQPTEDRPPTPSTCRKRRDLSPCDKENDSSQRKRRAMWTLAADLL